MNTLIAIGFVFGAAFLLVAVSSHWMKQKKLTRFFGRKRLTDQELLEVFSSRGLSDAGILTLLQAVEQSVEIPRGLLRPTDRFTHELSAVRGWEFDDGLILLPDRIAIQYGGNAEDYLLPHAATLQDLANRVATRRVQGKS